MLIRSASCLISDGGSVGLVGAALGGGGGKAVEVGSAPASGSLKETTALGVSRSSSMALPGVTLR
jgi:hypothetical protein